MERFQWVFELIDKVTKPAKQASGATEGFGKELKKVEDQIERIKHNPIEFKKLQAAKKELRELSGGSKSFADRFEEMGQAVRRVGFVQNLMLGVEALHLLYEAGEKVVEVVYDIGKELVGAAGHAERMGIAFHTLAGDAEGSEALEYIDKIKKSSELSGAQLQEMGAQLLTAGFHAKELGNALPAALDLAGFRGGGIDKVQNAIDSLARIRSTGKVENRSLANLGLGENSQTNLLNRLSKDKGQSVDAIKKAMEAGKLDPAEVLHEVYEMIIERQHGALGTTAEKMTNTVTGKLAKLRQLPEEIFEKWANSPGFAKFSDALGKILDKLSPDGPNGQKIYAAIDTISMKVVGFIDKFASGDGIDRFVSAITDIEGITSKILPTIDGIVTASEVLATIWAGSKIVSAFSGIASVLPAIAGSAGALAGPLGAVGLALGSIALAYQQIGKTVDELGGWDRVTRDFKDWLGGAQPAASDGPATESSPLWRQMGMGGRGDVGIPAGSMRTRPGNASTTVHAPINVTVNAPGGNADEIKEALNQSLPGTAQQVFERMGISQGAM